MNATPETCLQAAPTRALVATGRLPQTLRLAARLAVCPSTLALTDQAIVSGTNFLSTVLVGRFATTENLGTYSLGFTILVVASCAQEALVSAPYVVFGSRLVGRERAEYAGSALIHHWLVASLITLGLTVAAMLLSPSLAVVAIVMPAALAREFSRRLAFAHLRFGTALCLDAAVAFIQVAALAALVITGGLNGITALGAIGLACALVAGIALFAARHTFVVSQQRVWGEIPRTWAFGKWLLAGQTVGAVHGFVVYWLLALVLGTSATGTFAAAMTVVLLSNPLILGLANLLGPRAAHAFASGGAGEVRREMTRQGLVLAGLMCAFCAIVALFGEQILGVLYGATYAGQGGTVAILAGAILMGGLGLAPECGLRALGRSDLTFRASVLGLVITATTATLLALAWGVPGGAWGYLVGSAAGAAVRVGCFLRVTRPNGAGRTP